MGLQQSKDELVYQQVNYGNSDGIKALRSEGAGLEWLDKEGKTPLIVACMNPQLYDVAKTLIELGANVNAYRPGRHAGTPLHHAAKRGLEQMVKLLISHGANPLLMNDDCQTPLDVARIKGFSNVVRAIESHICLFSGWLRELYGPGFLELLAPQLLSRKVWVVVLPCGSRNLSKPFKLELAIYTTLQDAQPRSIFALWKANMDEPNFSLPDPAVVITSISNIPRRWRRKRGIVSSQMPRGELGGLRQARIKLAPANESDKPQLQMFCNACKGIPQVMHPAFPFNAQRPPVIAATAPPAAEDLELAMAINASLHPTPPLPSLHLGPTTHASTSSTSFIDNSIGGGDVAPPQKGSSSGWEHHEASSSNNPPQYVQTENSSVPPVQATPNNEITAGAPSAPPIGPEVVDEGPIQYPSIDFDPTEVYVPTVETLPGREDGKKEDSSCVICLDAPVEGACIPCGHMAGCMSCLNEIKAKKWGCPVCRAKINQVVRLYAV